MADMLVITERTGNFIVRSMRPIGALTKRASIAGLSTAPITVP